MTQSIEIIVSPEGKTRVETKGFVGSNCRDTSRFVQQALGRVVQEQLKPEFHQSTTQVEPLPQQC